MERDRRRGLVFWTPAPLGPPSSDTSVEEEEEEEEGNACSGVDRGLEQALDHIVLGEDETGLGAHCGDADVNINRDNFHTLPTEGDYDDRLDLDHGLHLDFGSDLDFSDKDGSNPEEHSHTPTICLNALTRAELHIPEEQFPSHYISRPPARAHSLPLLTRPEAITDEILPAIPFWDSSTDSQDSPRSSPRPEKRIDSNSHHPSAETRALNEHRGRSKIPVKVIKKTPPEDTHTSPSKAGSGPLKSSCQTRPSPFREKRARRTQAAVFRIPNVLMPDLSKVEPRVRFPKDGYTPPKGRCSLRSACLSPEPPLMYKSPADIVKEVLLTPNSQEEASQVLDALSIVPPEFRSRQQAKALMDELQEDNYRLKIKCAEKANTIDRLRLEGKVNLFSDPPKPGLPLYSGLRTQASQPLTVEIPRTHRAQFSSSLQTGTSTSNSGGSCSDVFDRLCHAAQMFLHNMEAFEGSIDSGTVQPEKLSEVARGLSELLNNLEKGYLLAKKEHTQQQFQHEDTGSFDPQRELESLIFQCGQRMDELKERVQLALQTTPTHRTTPPFTGHPAGESLQHGSFPTSTSAGNCPSVAARLQSQAQRILQSVEAYEAMLENGKLQTEQQRKVVFELIQKMNALEEEYILAKEEHRRQKMDSFDPRGEVESLVLQCGQQLDELNDRVQSDQSASLSTPTHAPPVLQAPPTSITTPTHAPPVLQAPPTTLTTPTHAPPVLQAPPTSLTTSTHAPPVLQAPPTTLTTPTHAPPVLQAPPTTLTTPTHAPPILQAPPTSLTTPTHAPPVLQAPPTALTTPTHAPPVLQAPPTTLPTPTHAPPVLQAPPTSLTTPTHAPPVLQAPPTALTTPTHAPPVLHTPPTSLTPRAQARHIPNATPTLPLQTPPLSAYSAVAIQCPASAQLSSPSSSTVRSSASEEDQSQALKSMSPEPLNKHGADQPDSIIQYQSLKVLHKPLVRDLSEGPCRGLVTTTHPECECDEGRRLSMAYPQRQHQYGREAGPSRPAARSRLPNSQPIHPPSHGTSGVGHPSTLGALVLAQTVVHGPCRGGSEEGQSPSSSLSSLRDAPETTDKKAPSERQRGSSQDGVISPETDSGFLGSEGSRLTPAAAASPVHQREPPGGSGVPLVEPCPAPALSRHGPSARAQQQSRRSRRGEWRRTSSASHAQNHRVYTTQGAADRESGLSGHNRLHSSITSEEDQSEHSSGSAFSFRRHGDLRKAPHSGRGPGHNSNISLDTVSDIPALYSIPEAVLVQSRIDEALELLQAEVLKLKYNMDTFVRSRDRAERRQPSTSTPVSRSDRHKAGCAGRLERVEPEEDARSQQRKSVSSKTSQTDHHFGVQVSRPTQTSADHCARTIRQLGPSKEKTDAKDRPLISPVCPECTSRGISIEGSFKGNPSKHATDCAHCRLCGPTESDWFSPRGAQTLTSDRPVHCVPVCPHPVLLYSCPPPVHLCPTKSEGPSRLWGSTEGRSQRSVPTDGHASLDTSLNRALRAAWSMKSTSRHMVHTLASGLQYQHTLHLTR